MTEREKQEQANRQLMEKLDEELALLVDRLLRDLRKERESAHLSSQEINSHKLTLQRIEAICTVLPFVECLCL